MITGRLEGGISMKYKILIIGEDYSNVNDIYDQFRKIYEVLISSPIAADISAHVNYFRPDMIMLSLEGIHDYVVDEFKAAKAAYSNLQGIPFAAAGNKDDLMWFEQQWAGLADLKIDIDKKMLDIQLEVDVKIDKAAKKNAKASAQEVDIYNNNQNKDGKKTILVVDGSPIMLKVIREQLKEFYDVVIVTNGKLALKYLKENKVDMMLLDYDMPEMSGLDVLKTMKADTATRNIPAVFLTGVSDRAKIAQALALGPQGYLLKPIDKEKLFAMIHKCIG